MLIKFQDELKAIDREIRGPVVESPEESMHVEELSNNGQLTEPQQGKPDKRVC
jgi:hypothetical protein